MTRPNRRGNGSGFRRGRGCRREGSERGGNGRRVRWVLVDSEARR